MRDQFGGRLPTLDGMRAIAIVLVVLSHVWMMKGVPEGLLLWIPHQYGDTGVRIFFVISGFLITSLLLREWELSRDLSLKKFYIRRILRIIPVYTLFLSVLAIFHFLGAVNENFSSWVGSLTFTRNVVGRGDDVTSHLWSLAVEEQFYLVWPFMLLIGLRAGWTDRHWLRVALGLIVLAVAVRLLPVPSNSSWARLIGDKSIFRYVDGIAIGCAAAFLFIRGTVQFAHASLLLWGGLLVAFAVVMAERWAGLTLFAVLRTLEALSVAAVILGGIYARQSVVFGLLNWGPVRYIGVLSYSIYIWHPLFLNDTLFPALGIDFSGRETVFRLLIIPVVLASYHLFELPILRAKSRWQRRASGAERIVAV